MIQTGCARMLMRVKVSPHVETVVVLSRHNVDGYVEVTLEANG
jgi:hypothetical protein